MAEWALLIAVFVIVGGTWLFSLRLSGTRETVLLWIGAAFVLMIVLGIYGGTKVGETGQAIQDRYQIEEI